MTQGLEEEWEKVRAEVFKRDKGRCQCCAALSMKEMLWYKKTKRKPDDHLECAHHIPRSYKDTYCDPNNLAMLCPEHHFRIDHYYDPVTGKQMSHEQREAWWKRILKDKYTYFQF